MKKDLVTQLLEAQGEKIRLLEEANRKQQDMISMLKKLCDGQERELQLKQTIIEELESKLDSLSSS